MKRKYLAVVPLAAALLLFAGCELTEKGAVKPSEAKKDPGQTISDSWQKNSEITSSTDDMKLTLSGASGGQEVSGTLSATVSSDTSDMENPVMGATVSGTVDAGDAGTFGLKDTDIRMKDNKVYFNIGGIDITGDADMQAALTLFADYFNKWYVVDPESETFKELAGSVPTDATGVDTSQIDPALVDKIIKMVYDQNIFADLSYDGEEKVYEVNCVKISFKELDADALIELVKNIAKEIQGDEYVDPTEEDVQQMKDQLAEIAASGTLWIDTEAGYLKKISIDITVGEGSDAISVGLETTISNINQSVSVDTPSGAEDFMTTVQELMTMMMGGTTTDLKSMYNLDDYSTYSDEELEDYLNMIQ